MRMKLHKILITSISLIVCLMFSGQSALSQNEHALEYIEIPEVKGDVMKIEEWRYYTVSLKEGYALSDFEVYSFGADGKLFNGTQFINRSKDNNTSRRFEYNTEGNIHSITSTSGIQNTVSKEIRFFYNEQGKIVRREDHLGKNISSISFDYNRDGLLVKKTRKNARGKNYQVETFTYDGQRKLQKWESKDLIMKSNASKLYSYSSDGGRFTTRIEETEFTGAKSVEYEVRDTSDMIVNTKLENANGIGNYDISSYYKVDSKGNWIRRDYVDSRHRFNYTLRRITYADGTVTGHVKPLITDSYVEWKRDGKRFDVLNNSKDVRKHVKSSFLTNSNDVLGYDLETGMSFIMEDFKNDSTDTWKPVKDLESGIDLHWAANDNALWVYYKGNSVPSRKALVVNDDVIVYVPSAHQSFLLENYNEKKDEKLHGAKTLSLATNAFWFKTEGNSFRLIINGAYAGGALPNKWLNSTDIVINSEAGEPRFALKGYANAEIGKLYPATPYSN